MPPRQASQCCRALRRHVSTAQDGIWISDQELAAAFDRFCAVSKRARRNVSHVPGPLESQRRLGKRQMADLNAIQLPPALPAWAFPCPVDLSKWRWQPPLSAVSRREEEGDQSRRLDSWGQVSLPGWLGRWLSQPDEDELAPVSMPLPNRRVVARDAPSFETEVEAFCAFVVEGTAESLAKDFPSISHQLQQYIYLGQISNVNLPAVTGRLWAAVDAKFLDSPVAQDVSLSLCSAIVTGIVTSRVLEPSLLGPGFWNSLLIRMSKITLDDRVWALFKKLTGSLSKEIVGGISQGILSILHALFSHWSLPGNSSDPRRISELRRKASCASSVLHRTLVSISLEIQRLHDSASSATLARARKQLGKASRLYRNADHAFKKFEHALQQHTRHVRQMETISEALRAVCPEHDDQLLYAATQILEQASMSAETRRYMRYNWLSILAGIPSVNQSVLFDISASLFAETAGSDSLNGYEICSLLLSHWRSQQYLPDLERLQSRYDTACAGQETKALAALAMAIHPGKTATKCRKVVLFSLCEFLSRLNRSKDILVSFRAVFSKSQWVPLRLLQLVAAVSNDHRLAVDLRELYMEKRGPGAPDWYPGVFRKYAADILTDPSLPSGTIWKVLDMAWFQKGPVSRRRKMWRHLGSFGAVRAAIAKRVAVQASSAASSLPRRVAFRHVSQSLKFLAALNGRGGLDVAVVEALFRVVSQDLVEGRPGRTARLRWFLLVIHAHYGRETALACGLAIKRWRASNLQKQRVASTVAHEQAADYRRHDSREASLGWPVRGNYGGVDNG